MTWRSSAAKPAAIGMSIMSICGVMISGDVAMSQQIPLAPIVVRTPLDGTVVTTTKALPAAPTGTLPAIPPGATADDVPAIAAGVLFPPTAIDALSGASAVDRGLLSQSFNVDRVSVVMRTLPGVTTMQTARDTAQSINIRGLQDFGRVNVLIDGMRQNFQRSGHSANGAFYIEPEMIKAIDVTRGPTATIYGSGAIGGVVAFEVIDADDVLAPGETVATRLKARYSSNGRGMFLSSSGAMRIGNFDVVGQLNGRSIADYSDGAGARIANSAEDTVSGLARFRWRSSEGHTLTGTLIDYTSEFIDSTVTGSTPRDTTVRNQMYNLGYTFSRADMPWISIAAKIYRNETDLTQIKLTAPSLGSSRGFNVITDGFDVSNRSIFSWGAARMVVTVGVDGFEDTVTTVDPVGNGDELTPGGRRTVLGGFAQSHLTLFRMIDIIAAARYDTYSLEGGTTSLEGSRLSPKITLGITPVKGVTVFGTYAEGYRAPAVTETLIAGFHPPPAPFQLLPNPNLRPEVAHTIEGGVNIKLDGVIVSGDAFRAKVTVFHNDLEDYIGGVFSPFPLPFGQYQYQNIANALLKGVELEAAYDARSWFLLVAAHRIRGTNVDTGQPLLTVPADQVTVTLGARLLEERLVAGVRSRFVDAQDRVPTGTAAVAAYTVVDLFATFQPGPSKDLILTLNVDNLFDEKYIQYLDQSNSPGLAARLGVMMRFGVK